MHSREKDTYSGYTAEDFVMLESFQNFVFNTNERDVQFWTNWLKRNPRSKMEIQLASDYLRTEYTANKTLDEEAIQEELERFFFTMNDPSSNSGATSIMSRSPYRVLVATVSLAVLATLAVLFLRPFDQSQNEVADIHPGMLEKSNPRGQKLIFQLPDGSKVKLNAEGKLRFPQMFSSNERVVYLTGEAYFDVVRNEDKPFKVVTENIEVKVLGTSFVVNAYTEELQELVLVESGKVEVTGKNAGSVLLYPEQMTLYNKASPSLAKATADPKFMAWKNETLYFKEAGTDELIKSLERWYDVEIEIINPSDTEVLVTGEFINQSLRNVLTGLSYTSGFDYQINDNNVKITIK